MEHIRHDLNAPCLCTVLLVGAKFVTTAFFQNMNDVLG